MCEHKVIPNMNNILGKAMVRGVGSVWRMIWVKSSYRHDSLEVQL